LYHAEEFPFVSIIARLSGLALAASFFTGLLSSARAQTAPQLIPYTVKVVAGGGTAAIAAGAACPSSGLTATDAFGDGCLATEIQLTSPRYAIADSAGNIFFSDYTASLIRRIDALTGVVSLVAGGAATAPAAGATCGTLVSLDVRGDGCLATGVKLSHPVGMAFAANGDLYFGDTGLAEIRKISATAGLINPTGVISLVAGNLATTFGYTANFGTTTINAATASYLDAPYDLAFDASGNLYIAEEFKEALLVINTNATGSTTVAGVTIPAGTIAKITGATSAGSSTCPNSPASTNGCSFGLFTSGAQANSSLIDAPYALGVDPAGNVYFANEFEVNVGKVSPAGILTNFAGIQGTVGKTLKRGAAGSFGIGSPFGIAVDPLANVYVTDASSGVIWRIDGAGQSMYPIAGGAATFCAASTDAYGDGCPALQAKFGSSGTTFASTSGNGPGIFGVNVDAYSNLLVGDTVSALIRQVSSGTQFGTVGLNAPTQTVDIHFATSDQPSTYTVLPAGNTNFTLGTAACTANSDGTTDCLLPITATPTLLGPFTGTLQVKSTLGATASFPLSGTFVKTPATRTSVAVTGAASTTCTGTTTTYSTTAPLTLTATIISSGSPTGTITFFANGTQIGTPQPVSTNGTATLTNTFSTAGTYSITAVYSGDGTFTTSTSPGTSITSSAPTFAAASVASGQSTVVAGQTALYSFNLVQSVYAGNITFACSGLPSYSSCSFSPATIVANGCSTTNTVAMSIVTQQSPPVIPASIAFGGRGFWSLLGIVPGVLLASLIQLRRRRTSLRYAQFGMALALLLLTSGLAACGKSSVVPPTPSGTYTVTVTATGSAGSTAVFTVPLTVK
jgi:hypothetical protein